MIDEWSGLQITPEQISFTYAREADADNGFSKYNEIASDGNG